MGQFIPPRPTAQRMQAVHVLGHPSAPPPQTNWNRTSRGKAGAPDVTAAPVMAPNAPITVSLAQGTGSDLSVTWTAPGVDATHSVAASFNLQVSPSGAGAWILITGVTCPYDLTNLTAATAYDIQVQGVNAGGVGPWSASATLTTATLSPNAPSITSVAPPPDGTAANLAVSWSAPETDATHGPAIGYNLRYSPSGAGTWTTVSGVTSPYTIAGLSGGAAYDVQVQATNATPNPGAWSSLGTGTTWGATVAQGGWTAAATQTHGASVAPSGGVQMVAVAAPTAVAAAAFAWSISNTVVPSSGLIAAGADGQSNGWGQWFNTPATTGTYYLWLLAQNASGGTIGALVTPAITVS